MNERFAESEKAEFSTIDTIKSIDGSRHQMIPSDQESAAAIAAAKHALEDYGGRFWLGNLTKVEREFCDLDLFDERERFMAIDIALQEITPADRNGPNPPGDISAHPPFKENRLFAFCWDSAHFQKRMYFKFAVVGGCGKARLAVYSLHEPKF